MAEALRPLVAGNWKMNGLKASLAEAAAIREAVADGAAGRADILVCPPFTLVAAMADLMRGTALRVGGQTCHVKPSGAHTGDVSAEMLKDAGATAVIVGHSERRADHGETDAEVAAQATAALRAGLQPIVCIGETRAERDAGATLSVLERQIRGSLPETRDLSSIVVAYEPVWAIGTGLVPTLDDVAEAHAFVREVLNERAPGQGETVRLLYGGSVKPTNARSLMGVAHVNGALVGGASLTAADFMGIAAAYR